VSEHTAGVLCKANRTITRTIRSFRRKLELNKRTDEPRPAPATTDSAGDFTIAGYKPPATPAMLKIGRNMAMTIPPTITPRKTINNGSIRDVRDATVASHSVS